MSRLLCIFTITHSNTSSNNKDSTSNESQDNVDKKEDIPEITESELNEIEKYMNAYDNVLIRKTVSKNIVQTKPEYISEFIADENIISEISILKNTDITRTQEDYIYDYRDNLLDFEEFYNFDYKKYENIYDVIVGLAEAQGINTDFSNSTLDEQLYEATEQKVYILNEDSNAIKKIISDLDYDEILDAYSCFKVSESGAHSYISYINTCIQYTKERKTIFYNLHFQISIYNDGEAGTSCGCGCGSVSESECSDDDCALCELEESSE